MFLERQFKTGGVIATAVLLSFPLTPLPALSEDESVQEEEQSSSEPIEEVTVYGDKTLYHYRLEMFRAEDKVFDVFNSLNSDDEFDVHCYRDAKTGTRVKRRHCRPNFVRDAESTEAMNFMMGYPHNPARTVIMWKQKKLIEEMDRLVNEHPELLEVVVEYAAAIENLVGARHEKCDGRMIACSP
jgi:hypothetical protein